MANHDSFGFDANNAIASALSGSGAPSGIPGLTHPRIQISDASGAALLQMAKEDPALYGRIVQHLNGLDRGKDWTVKLEGWSKGAITGAQHQSYLAQVERSLSDEGLGSGGKDTTYFNGLVQYESVERTKLVEAPKPGNAEAVAAMQEDIQAWNEEFASKFEFEHDVADRVKNPEATLTALSKLAAILEKHESVLGGATIELGGHTSTVGSDAYNQTLSEERAQTIADLLAEAVSGSGLEDRLALSFAGYGETEPVGHQGQPLALGADGRPLNPAQEDAERSRRVAAQVTLNPLVVEGEPGQSITWRDSAGVALQIKAKAEPSGGSQRRDGSQGHVTKSRISKQIGGEIPCKDWMKTLIGR